MNLVTLIPPHGVYPGPVCAVACLWNGQKTPWEQKQVCQSPESCPGQHFILPVFAGDRITHLVSKAAMTPCTHSTLRFTRWQHMTGFCWQSATVRIFLGQHQRKGEVQRSCLTGSDSESTRCRCRFRVQIIGVERALTRRAIIGETPFDFEIRRELKRLLPYIGLYRKLRIVSTKRMRPHVFYNVVYGFRSWEK